MSPRALGFKGIVARAGAAALLVAGLGSGISAASRALAALHAAPAPRAVEGHSHLQWVAGIDLTHLPVGSAVSTTPAAGAVYSCNTSFNGGGAMATGAWMNPDGTFDLTAKPLVDGAVTWTSTLTVSLDGDKRVFSGNGLPYHTTGTYPVSRSDDAYAYDRNPNTIAAQQISVSVPATPPPAAQAACLPMGAIGVMRTGSVFFNSLDAAGRDAVAYELQDECHGHPERNGTYHYHSLSPCVSDVTDDDTAHSPLVGYAFDGFGLFGPRGHGGVTLANTDLDECHGHTHEIEWDGQLVSMYHYHATWTYPYTLGCFRGTQVATTTRQGPGPQAGAQGTTPGQMPPPNGQGMPPGPRNPAAPR